MQKVPINNGIKTEAKLHLVNTYLVNENWAKAKEVLASISKVETEIEHEITWLYVLICLGESNLTEVRKLAEKLSQSPNKYQQSAQQILGSLR